MSLRKDIVLCYAEDDNQPIEGGLKGWVSNFYKFLSTLLSQISKDNPTINMVNIDDWKSYNTERVGVLILVTSPNLIVDKEAMGMINDFTKTLKANNELSVGNHSRIFKVNKAPFDADLHLSELTNDISYDFYLIDALTGEAHEFKRFFGTEAERGFWMKLVDMAYDINQIVTTKTKDQGSSKAEFSRDKTVYLASSGVDMVIQRDVIKRELIRHGYRVLPQRSLPKEVKALEEMVREDLHHCCLSIHMVGEDYGYKPKGSEISVVDIQNRMAANHAYEILEFNETAREVKPFSRLIWVSPDLKNVTERQKIFIEDLKSDAATLEEAEVLQISIPELKSIIREELVTGGRFKTHRDIAGFDQKDDGDAKIVYLINDKSDQSSAEPIKKYLEEKGLKVVLPSFEGDLVDIRYIHQENLRRCDASLIYFGQSTEAWIKTKLQDLLKAPGFGRQKKFLAKAVYFESAKEIDKQHFENNKAMILGENGAFKPEHLAPFINKLDN
ncbi:MAG: hypothetical protein ACI93L_002557 [Cyclobacteriaceae bacterium]|jgi:hypothetical protein